MKQEKVELEFSLGYIVRPPLDDAFSEGTTTTQTWVWRVNPLSSRGGQFLGELSPLSSTQSLFPLWEPRPTELQSHLCGQRLRIWQSAVCSGVTCCVNIGNLFFTVSHFLRADYLPSKGKGLGVKVS